jgi:hypothetical protein
MHCHRNSTRTETLTNKDGGQMGKDSSGEAWHEAGIAQAGRDSKGSVPLFLKKGGVLSLGRLLHCDEATDAKSCSMLA